MDTIQELFQNVDDTEMKNLYEAILRAREEGLRARELDPYITKVVERYPSLTFGEAWRMVEPVFFEEVTRRYFSII